LCIAHCTDRLLRFDEVAHDLVVEVLHGRPADALRRGKKKTDKPHADRNEVSAALAGAIAVVRCTQHQKSAYGAAAPLVEATSASERETQSGGAVLFVCADLSCIFLLFLFDRLFDEHLLQLLVHEIDAD